MKKSFKARLVGRGPKGAWTHLPIPFDVREAFGKVARVAVKGSINGFAFRSTLAPEGEGKFYLMVNKEMCAGAKVAAGHEVSVVMEPDAAPRVVEVPPELQAALAKRPKAGKIFAELAPSHRKEFAAWIAGAKQAETKARRVEKALEMIEGKVRFK